MASEASDECIGRVKPPTYAPWQVTACSDGGVYYWNVTSASLLHEQSFVHKDWATSVALLGNGYNGCNGCSVFCTSPPPHLSSPPPSLFLIPPPPLRSLAREPHERGTNTLAHMHALAGDDGRCVGEGEREGEFERTGGQRVVTGGFDMDLVVHPFPPT